MLRVIVEIHPMGYSEVKRTIATIDLANVSGLAELSDYLVTATLEGEGTHRSEVKGHRRSAGWMSLVGRALAHLIGRPAPMTGDPDVTSPQGGEE